LGLDHIDSENVRQMDSVTYMPQLREVGRVAGKKQVTVELQVADAVRL
jgi:hypothetical protein